MLAETLRMLEADFPSTIDSSSLAIDWSTKTSQHAKQLEALGSALLNSLQPVFPHRVYDESLREIIVPRAPAIEVAQLRLRPQNDYYERALAPVPAPMNPNGSHATGIAFGLSLLRGFINGRRWRRPRLSIELTVWGKRERAAFVAMFLDHQRLAWKLLRIPSLEFYCASWLEEVEKPTTRSAMVRLDRYLGQKSDPESCFTLSRAFEGGESVEQLCKTAMSLLAFYDACFGYCGPRKSKDRLARHSLRMRQTRHVS